MGDQPKAAHKSSKPIFEAHTESKGGKKVLFCKKYQSDECHTDLKNNAHWGQIPFVAPCMCHLLSKTQEVWTPSWEDSWLPIIQ